MSRRGVPTKPPHGCHPLEVTPATAAATSGASQRTLADIEKRVSLYEELTKSTNPFAKLKALERIDELSGIITDAEAMKSRKFEEAPQHQPIFMFQGPMSNRFRRRQSAICTADRRAQRNTWSR